MLRGFFYRLIMRVAHRFNWHYAPPIYPENDVQLWCKWCGFRMTLPHEERIARVLKHDYMAHAERLERVRKALGPAGDAR